MIDVVEFVSRPVRRSVEKEDAVLRDRRVMSGMRDSEVRKRRVEHVDVCGDEDDTGGAPECDSSSAPTPDC